MPYDTRRNDEDPAARARGAKRPVGVLGVREERLVEASDLDKRLCGDEHRATARAVGAVRRGRLGEPWLPVPAVGAVMTSALPKCRAGVPDHARVVEEDDLRARRTHVLAELERVDQRLDEPRLDDRVVVEEHDVLGAVRERFGDPAFMPPANPRFVSSRTSTTPGCSLATASGLPSHDRSTSS